MVKQYKDGYFLNGKWYSGQYNATDEVSNYIKKEIIDPMNKDSDAFIKCIREQISDYNVRHGNDIIKVEHTESVYLPDNAWSNGNYGEIEEPYETKYITYLFYGIIVILVLAILFVLIQF